jgi:hypothetical protein
MSLRKVKVDREFFINHCSNWLPEHKDMFIGFLKFESEGRISFYVQGRDFIIRDNRNDRDRLIGGGNHGRRGS